MASGTQLRICKLRRQVANAKETSGLEGGSGGDCGKVDRAVANQFQWAVKWPTVGQPPTTSVSCHWRRAVCDRPAMI